MGGGAAQYFKQFKFFAEYSSIDVTDVPDEIAIIPFVTNILPLVWLLDETLCIDALDLNFYNCLENIKKGYMHMYPEAAFRGKIQVLKLSDCSYDTSDDVRTAFFSGGVDAVSTLIRHIDECPSLITIWGSDLRMQDVQGWAVVKNAVSNVGKEFGLENLFIKSNFNEFLEERKLSYKFWDVIHGYWYHHIQHGIGMLGLIAPIAYERKIKVHYIASSYSINKEYRIECASDPSIDNELRFGSCLICHDAFEYSRQDKIHSILNYCRETDKVCQLRVCWSDKNGNNCCRCEKCYRTIMGIIAENGDPQIYGFKTDIETLQSMKNFMTLNYQPDNVSVAYWKDIQRCFELNNKLLKKNPYYRWSKWIVGFDFNNIKDNRYHKWHDRKAKLISFCCRLIPRKVKNYLKKYIHFDL